MEVCFSYIEEMKKLRDRIAVLEKARAVDFIGDAVRGLGTRS